MILADLEASIAKRGWAAVDLPDPTPVFRVGDQLLAWIRKRHRDLSSLDQYHTLGLSDEQHFALQYDLSLYYWDADLGRDILRANLDLFRALLGPDLHGQRYPYLRAVRPGKPSDAAPIHRDTYYGASPYEVSAVIPFTEMDPLNAMRVISGSHLAPDRDYPYTQTVSEDVVTGSPKHKLGYAYAPRLLDPKLLDQAEAVPLRLGQALLFPLSLVHGGGNATGHRTRFSTDIRVVNSWAPVAFSRGVHPDYFLPLCSSPVTSVAQRFLETNRVLESDPSGKSAADARSGEPR